MISALDNLAGPGKPTLSRHVRRLRLNLLDCVQGNDSQVMDMHVQRLDPRGQIKTRERVRDLAEVYTHEREVNAMLNLIPDMFPVASTRHVDVTFLEPACGSGNFFKEILLGSEPAPFVSPCSFHPCFARFALRFPCSI